MKIAFTKMQGLGNDFMVIDATCQKINLTAENIRQLADRKRGIGFDQCLIVEPTQNENADFYYRIYNSDGGEVEQCGNGARCLAKFIRDQQLSAKDLLYVTTKNRRMSLEFCDNDLIRVSLGHVELSPEKIPLKNHQQQAVYQLHVEDSIVNIQALNVGNPHAVITSDDLAAARVEYFGPRIEHHVDFPEGVNVGFMQIIDKQTIRLRVYERGAGETDACGSGACAAVAAGILSGKLNNKVTVYLPGGELIVEWQGDQTPIYLTGPAVSVFRGEVIV